MTIWDVLSFIAHFQLFGKDGNILGVLWAVILAFFAFNRFIEWNQGFFLKPKDKNKLRYWWLIPFLTAVVAVVWIQFVVDDFIITPTALMFGRWVEVEIYYGPLSIWSFLMFKWHCYLVIILFTKFCWQHKIFKFFHFTKYSLIFLIIITCYWIIGLFVRKQWSYSALANPERTRWFWTMYPEIRFFWALLFVSILKKPPEKTVAIDSVKEYYVKGEHYDWITDPRGLEKIFHNQRETDTLKFINKYSSNSKVLDIGCGTGRITRNLHGDVTGLDINRWNIEHAKIHASNATFILGDCENMPEITSSSIDLIVFTETLEHLTNPIKALKEIQRILKINGKVVITVPSNLFVWKFRRFLTTTHPHSEPFHRNFSKKEFRNLLADFRILELKQIVFGLTLLAVVEKVG